ncbi:MAG TPA: amylo-alpha-1,6-glucosidase [Alphaproteobacteria bacterium]|nr:amylo-alpha-1,6-glucosidase [Alphaproteobacteria bacterium]
MTEQASLVEAEFDPVPQFYIPATSSILERRPRTLKHGDTFAVFDHYGDIVDAARSPEGLYHEDTRHLSRLELLIEGRRLLLLSSTLQDDNAVLTVDLANPDIYRGGHIALSRERLHLIRSKFLWNGSCHERLAVHNFDLSAHRFRLGLRFAADFADLFEVRGIQRSRRGTTRIERPTRGAVILRYCGLDGVERTTRIEFTPEPTALTDDEAVFDISLAPDARTSIFFAIRCDSPDPAPRGAFFVSMRDARRALRAATSRFATVETSNALLNRVLCRSVNDLYMLLTDTAQGPYPYAGIPWFSTAFGRDGIITALQMLWLDPAVAKGVLGYLAATQAQRVDREADAEPGKILHETRRGEMARLGEVPFDLYYGSVDATPLFVLLAGRYFERTGDRATIQALWPHVQAALHWIDAYGDRDGDGFVEYQAHEGKGLTNQGWKDSSDSISHADGRLAEGAIALCEVQAYVYAAKRHAAAIARALGHAAVGAELEQQGEALRERFEAAFWCEDLGTYAIALDGAKRPCRVRSSNAGHVLFAGIAAPDRAVRVAATLLGRDSYSGWGIRTLAASARRYNPMSYHNGSVWPHDNALIALGFGRYGLKREAIKVFEGQFEAVQYMDLLRPPELFCGFGRRRNKAPTLYPVACSPQAWASASPLAFLEACLGLQCEDAAREVRFERPMLPPFVDEVRIRRLRLGEAHVDVLLRRHQSDVAVNVIERSGDIRVVVVN